MDRWQYLLLMAGCVLATLPLEFLFRAKVWRRPRRLIRALLVPVVVFSLWDVAAIGRHWWSYNPRYITGWDLPGGLPVEEVVFFVVVPVCALLTFETVERLLGRPGRSAGRRGRSGPVASDR